MRQFLNVSDPPQHQFVVFSIIDDENNVQQKFVQCNNCGVIHKVLDVCKSEIMKNREHMSTIITIDDIRSSISKDLANVLELNVATLPTWEACKFIIENKRWGEFVVLNTEDEDDISQGKYVVIIGENLFKVETFLRDRYLSE